MRAAHHRWLLEQLPQWQQEGLVTAEAANTLRQRSTAAAADGHSHWRAVLVDLTQDGKSFWEILRSIANP